MGFPSWSGAATVYARCGAICKALNEAAYAAQTSKSKGKKLKQFSPSPDAELIIEAMNKGDEESLKAIAGSYLYRHYWQEN